MNRRQVERAAAIIAQAYQDGDILTVGGAAEVAGVSGERISQIKGDRVPAVSAGAVEYIFLEDLEAWKSSRRVGRPPRPKD